MILIWIYIRWRSFVNKYYDILNSSDPGSLDAFLNVNQEWAKYVGPQAYSNDQAIKAAALKKLQDKLKSLKKDYDNKNRWAGTLAAAAPFVAMIPVVGTVAAIGMGAGSIALKYSSEQDVQSASQITQQNG